MSKFSRVIFAAAFAVGIVSVSFGATTSISRPDGLKELTIDTASRVTTTATTYAKKIEFSVSDEIATTLGAATMTDFPVLVRLSSTAVENYDASAFAHNGRDLYFEDENGTALSFELDTFDSAGETLVWVKIPSLSASTKFTCYYGGPENILNNPTDVWTGYLGVWHYNGQQGGVTPNATANADLDGSSGEFEPLSGANTPFGSAAVQAVKTIDVQDYELMYNVGKRFSASGWFKVPTQDSSKYSTFITKKSGLSWDATSGWYLEMSQSKTKMTLIPSSGKTAVYSSVPDVTANWNYFTITHDNGLTKVYLNGGTSPVISQNSAINVSSTMFKMLASGQQGDEYRLSKSTWSALRTSLEYKSMKESGFLSNTGSVVMDVTAPVFETPTVQVASDGSATMTFMVTSGEGEVSALVGDTTNFVGTIGTEISLNEPKTVPITISADACVSVGVYGINAKGTEVAKYADGAAMNAAIVAVATNDANERGLVPGVFSVSRPEGVATDLPIVVNLTWDGGTAVQGKNYVEELPATVTIPADAASTTVVVTPLRDAESDNDETIILTVAAGAYKSGATATMKILNLVTDPNYNTWVAVGPGKASEAANWSAGRAPIAEDNILFDGNFSNFGCSWDADATSTVASWTQRNGFTGIVTVETKYPEAANATFTKLTVTGDMVIDYGMLTQVSNDVQKEEYRLNVGIGGNLTIGSAGSIDVTGRGPRGVMSGRSANVYAGDQNTYQKTYGDPKRPYYCGSGNNGAWPTYYKGAGGGAAWIEVAGTAVVKGKILSEGSVLNSKMEIFDGKNGNISTSGGSIYLKAGALVGDGSGFISAKSEFSCNQDNQIGSGGRVAIELTETAYDFESGGVAIKANANAKQAGSPGHGTIVIKNPGEANGTLFVLGKHDRNFSYNNCEYTYKQTTAIPNGDTWTFDKVVVGDFGMITVGEGSTLSLPNGWASVYAKNKSTDALKKYACGIILRGGTLDVPAIGGKHEFKNGEWTFHPTGGFVLDADTEISGRANVGAMYLSSGTNTVMTCDVKVQGSLDIKSDGYMNAVYGGVGGTDTYAGEAYVPFHKNTVAFGTGHGGQNAHIGVQNLTYGSFFTPTLPGTPSGHADCRYVGGGVIMLEVTGALNVDGKIQSCSGWNGQYWNDRPSAPGSINIIAAQMAGSGSICADGAAGYVGTYPKTNWETQGPAGGGRVAVRLTGAGAAMPDSLFAKITAKGATSSGALKSDTTDASVRYSSAGSVYLQIAAEGERKGTIIIRNDGVVENTAWTSLPAAAETDEITDFKDAKLELLDCGKVRLYDTLAMSKLTMSVDTKLDLNGNTLTIKSAKLGDATLAAGTYAASDYSDYLTDSVGGGSLVVTGSAKRGMVIFYR